jgi:uncharacterized membrane protein
MKTVRKEWLEAKTPEQKLAWTEKWADLLLETWSNPIWLSGHTFAVQTLNEQMILIEGGEYPDNPVSPLLENHAKALALIHANLKVVQGELSDDSKTPEELIDMAIEQIGNQLGDYMHYDETTKVLKFEVVMVD